jgi:hypothetical protein
MLSGTKDILMKVARMEGVFKMKEFPDSLAEKVLRKYWEIFDLQRIYDDIDIDEFVRRAFKNYLDTFLVRNNRIYIETPGINGARFKQLAKFLFNHNLTMQIGNPKKYYEIYLSIKPQKTKGDLESESIQKTQKEN